MRVELWDRPKQRNGQLEHHGRRQAVSRSAELDQRGWRRLQTRVAGSIDWCRFERLLQVRGLGQLTGPFFLVAAPGRIKNGGLFWIRRIERIRRMPFLPN